MTLAEELRKAEREKRRLQDRIQKAHRAGVEPSERDRQSLEKTRRKIRDLADGLYLESLRESVSRLEAKIRDGKLKTAR